MFDKAFGSFCPAARRGVCASAFLIEQRDKRHLFDACLDNFARDMGETFNQEASLRNVIVNPPPQEAASEAFTMQDLLARSVPTSGGRRTVNMNGNGKDDDELKNQSTS